MPPTTLPHHSAMPAAAAPHSASRRVDFETASIWVLVLTIALSALLWLPVTSLPYLPTKVFVLTIGVVAALACYILARLTRGNVILPPALALGALWLPTLAYAFATVFVAPGGALAIFGASPSPDSLGFMVIVSVFGSLAALTLRRPEHYHSFLKLGFYAAFLILALQMLAIVIGQFAPGFISPSTSLVGSISDLATIAGLALILVLITLRLVLLAGRTKTALLALGLLALILLALTAVTAVWVVLALVSLGLFVEAVMRRKPSAGDTDLDGVSLVALDEGVASPEERSFVAPLVTLAVALFFLIGGSLGTSLADALHVSTLNVRPSWQATLGVGSQVFKSSPVFGAGPGTFGAEWLTYRDASLNQTIFWNIDFTSGIGFIPTSFITTGILGILAWLLFFGVLLVLGARYILLRITEDPFIRFVTIISFASAAYLAVSALFLNVGILPLTLLFVFAGLFTSTLRYAPGSAQWGIIFARSPRVGFVIVFLLTLVLLSSVVVAYTVVERYIAAVEVTRAEAALSSGDFAGADAAASRSLAFISSADAERTKAEAALGEMGQIANNTSLSQAAAEQQFQETLANGITAAVTATKLAPSDYQTWGVLANLYAAVVPLNVSGAYDNAKAAYEKAEAANPTSPLIPYASAQLEIAAKNTAAARADLTKAITLKQDYTPAILLLSQLEVSAGNTKDALAAAEAAAYFTPNNANILFQVGILRAASGDLPGAVAALTAATTADPQYANAYYFLAAVYAKRGDYTDALTAIQKVASLSADNATAVAPLVAALEAKKNPFPANLLTVTPPASK